MLKLNVNEEKALSFEFELSGLSPNQIDTKLRIMVDGIEYGFPAQVKKESISVDIPPLKKIIHRDFREGEVFDVRLEVLGDGHHLIPWEDQAKVHNPVQMEAKIQEKNIEDEKPAIKVTVSENKETKKTKSKAKTKAESIIKETKRAIYSSKEKVTKPDSKMSFEDFKKLKKEDVMKYIARRATKNTQIQEMIYNQAVTAAGTGAPYKVFPKVMEILRRDAK